MDVPDREYHQLLAGIKSVVEGLLASQSAIVWNIYGGLNRLHQACEKILQHGCKCFISEGQPEYLTFVCGSGKVEPDFLEDESISQLVSNWHKDIQKPFTREDKAAVWLYRSLEEHRLSTLLVPLLEDRQHVLSCYESNAFLCQPEYATALFSCLRAVEQNSSHYLLDIDPNLFLGRYHQAATVKSHHRSSSYPETVQPQKVPSDTCNRVVYSMVRDQTVDINLGKLYQAVDASSRVFSSSDEETLCVVKQRSRRARKVQMVKTRSKTWESIPPFNEDKVAGNSEIPQKRHHTWDGPQCSHSVTTSGFSDGSSSCVSPHGFSHQLNIDYSTSFHEGYISVLPEGFSSKSTPTEDIVKPSFNRKGHSHSKSDSGIVVQNLTESDAVKDNVSLKSEVLSSSVPTTLQAKSSQEEMDPPKSFMDDGGNSILPTSSGFFPRPQKGQSLTGFLSSGGLTCNMPDLDRENSHFYVAEAVIAAVEQMKCLHVMKSVDEDTYDSDEEIQNLQQRIRLRRSQRQREKQSQHQRQQRSLASALLSDGRTDTTDQSVSPPTSTSMESSDELLSDEVDDFDVDDSPNLAALKESELSLSMGSLYSGADVGRRPQPKAPVPEKTEMLSESSCSVSENITSAESIALSLLMRFSDKHMPRASELEWLVSEKDVAQSLLPLPSSWPVSPDEAEDEDMSKATELRGNLEWAPPRPQIVCVVHPTTNRKVLLARQKYRCAGCGMKVAIPYMKSFRYCHYLGKYFCTACHENQMAPIPGRVILRWDFSRYPVSKFSGKILERMHFDPLFNMKDLNESIYRKVRPFQLIYSLRLQLWYMKEYISNCRMATDVFKMFQSVAAHLTSSDLDMYSMNDLMKLRSGELLSQLKTIVNEAANHISTCEICQARGFICEVCRHPHVIFPFQFPQVVRCNLCLTCYHNRCFDPVKCPKCVRLESRRVSTDPVM